jgi:hypothetical protein
MNPHIAQEAVLEDAGTYSKGTPLITHNRITQRAVNRLWPASDEDIVVPGGVVSILGITSICGPHIMVYLFDRGELGAALTVFGDSLVAGGRDLFDFMGSTTQTCRVIGSDGVWNAGIGIE